MRVSGRLALGCSAGQSDHPSPDAIGEPDFTAVPVLG
jgi:hypothetical protein